MNLWEEIKEGLENGEFRSRLEAYCLDWRKHRSRHAINKVVGYTAESRRADALYSTIIDAEFRELRRSMSGINSLRADLHTGLEFFSRKQLDILRFIQILFLEQWGKGEPTAIQAHQRHCKDFTDFLQLDVPQTQRQDVGLHRVLSRFFPMKLEANERGKEPDAPISSTLVQLSGYEIGTWRCSCGKRSGQAQRYDYRCACGQFSGNGLLKPDTPPCPVCSHQPEYATCSSCETRVTLDLMWALSKGFVHPSSMRVPLTLDLTIDKANIEPSSLPFVLMQLPLMLGLRERDNQLVFDLPDLFWLETLSDGFGSKRLGSQLVALSDTPEYDRQKGTRRILESTFRRMIWAQNGPRSLRARLKKCLVDGRANLERFTDIYTRDFERRLTRALGAPQTGDRDLIRFADLSQECIVATSPFLRENMALVNRRLIRPGALSAPCIENVNAVFWRSRFGPDVLTSKPPQVSPSRLAALGDDGIALPGKNVEPGDVLVGISTPRGDDEMTQEEKLLHSIFGRSGADEPNMKDGSLILSGEKPGQVLSVRVSLGRDWQGPEILEMPGRFLSQESDLGSGELARVTVTLVVEQPLEVGDAVIGEDGSRAVVCGITGGAALMKMIGIATEPDLVVAPAHPWAQASDNRAARTARVGMESSSLLGRYAASRANGPYSFTSQRPIIDESRSQPAVELTSAEFCWLFERDARRLAIELYGPRCDCAESRAVLYKTVVKSDRRLSELQVPPIAQWRSLADSPSEGVRHWDQLMRAACVKPVLEQGRLMIMPMSDSDILSASFGEVAKPETLSQNTLRPVTGGLFCERIFGPERDWECGCGKYRGMKHKEIVCDRCGVLVTDSRVRSQRMGHIELSARVVHCWYLRGKYGLLGQLLKMDNEDLNQIVYCRRYVVTSPGSSPLRTGQILDEREFSDRSKEYRGSGLQCATGAEALAFLYQQITAAPESDHLLEGVVLRRLPVIPPNRRLLVALRDGSLYGSVLNGLYSRVISRNNRLRRLMDLNAPDVIIINEKRDLQECVDTLLDNERSGKPITNRSETLFESPPIPSISHHLIQLATRSATLRDGFLRRTVDYSARTRLVTDDTPSIDDAFLPDRLAWDLFSPLLIEDLKRTGEADTIKSAKRLIDRRGEEARAALESVCSRALVLLTLPSGPWRIVALRVRLTADLALKTHPDLLDRVGWDNLGKRVNLFAVLTLEAEEDARERLLPSRLIAEDNLRAGQETRSCPFFDLNRQNMIGELTRWIAAGQSFQLHALDYLLLGAIEETRQQS